MVFCSKDVLDLAVGFCLVRAVLDGIEIAAAHRERLQYGAKSRPGDKHLCGFRCAHHNGPCCRRHIDAFRFAVPNVDPAPADGRKGDAFHLHIHRAGGGHDARLVAGHAILERLAFRQLDDVEVIQRNQRIIDIYDGQVAVVMGRNVHGGS
jgi:hypothetical protein